MICKENILKWNSFFLDSAFAGVSISLIAYMAGVFLKKKFKTRVV